MEILNKALKRERELKEEAIAEKEMEMEQMRRQLAESTKNFLNQRCSKN